MINSIPLQKKNIMKFYWQVGMITLQYTWFPCSTNTLFPNFPSSISLISLTIKQFLIFPPSCAPAGAGPHPTLSQVSYNKTFLQMLNPIKKCLSIGNKNDIKSLNHSSWVSSSFICSKPWSLLFIVIPNILWWHVPPLWNAKAFKVQSLCISMFVIF